MWIPVAQLAHRKIPWFILTCVGFGHPKIKYASKIEFEELTTIETELIKLFIEELGEDLAFYRTWLPFFSRFLIYEAGSRIRLQDRPVLS